MLFSFQAVKIMDTLQTLVTTYGSSNSIAKILSSRDEGVYGWLTVNYLINGKNLAAENQVKIILSRDHLNSFSSIAVQLYDGMTKFRPSTNLSTNHRKADQLKWLKKMYKVKSFLLPLYGRPPVLLKELRRSRLEIRQCLPFIMAL